jgi:hypothetical protein
VNSEQDSDQAKLRQEAWIRLRGAAKSLYAEYGGGEAYLRKERQEFSEGTSAEKT